MARRVRRGVKARRVVRRFELWSVAKLALVFHLFCFGLTLAVMVALWNVAFRLGTITKLETFLSDFGFSDKVSKQDFRLHGDALFRAGALAGLGLVALNTLITVMLAFFYNGVSGLFGGVVVSVLEERPPLSPAERRAVGAEARGERLALPSGRSDEDAKRRERRKGLRAAQAAAKAEASALRMAEATATAPSHLTPEPEPTPEAAHEAVVVPEPEAVPQSAVVTEDGTVSVAKPRPKTKAKQRNGKPRPRPSAGSEPAVPVGPIAEQWAAAAADEAADTTAADLPPVGDPTGVDPIPAEAALAVSAGANGSGAVESTAPTPVSHA
jgi:hypothetical protein